MGTAQSNQSNPQIHSSQSDAATIADGGLPYISSSKTEYFSSIKHAENSLEMMENLFHNQQLTDVILIAGNKRIPAHRLVLSAASDYFAAMFTGSMRETVQNEVELKEIDGNVLLAIVQYCYTGCIELREDNFETLFGTARLLQLSPVVEACCRFVIKEMDPSNCLGIKIFADIQGCAHLSSAAHAYALENFVEVVKNQEFLSLSTEEVSKLFESDDINVPSEETIFHALLTWVRHDFENRYTDAIKLLRYVKVPLLSPTFICDSIESINSLKGQNINQKLIAETFKCHLFSECWPQVLSGHAKPRKAAVPVLLAIGGTDDTGPMSIEAFSLTNKAWKNVAGMNKSETYFDAAIVGRKLLVVGGSVAGRASNTLESFNFTSLSWDKLSPMNMFRGSLGVAVLKGSLYAVGGCDGSSILNTVERWDSVADRWTYVTPMLSKRSGVGVAVHNNKLYAIGGWDGSTALSTVECYDPEKNTWTFCACMCKRRRRVSVTVFDNHIYVLGGYDEPNYLDSVERYDFETDTWCCVAPMKMARCNIGVGAVKGLLFSVGGWNGRQCTKRVEAYDPLSDKWCMAPSLGAGRLGPCLVVNNLFLPT